jgi:hypothetical protein
VEEAELLQLLGPGQGADVERRRPPSAASWASFCRGAFWDELGDLLGRGGPSLRGALEVIHQRHERFDGHGYPDGLAGEQISLAARIVAVVDVWDALTSAAPARTDGGHQRTQVPEGMVTASGPLRGAYNTRRSAVSPWRQVGLPGESNAGAADLDLVRMTTPGVVP